MATDCLLVRTMQLHDVYTADRFAHCGIGQLIAEAGGINIFRSRTPLISASSRRSYICCQSARLVARYHSAQRRRSSPLIWRRSAFDLYRLMPTARACAVCLALSRATCTTFLQQPSASIYVMSSFDPQPSPSAGKNLTSNYN